MTGGAVPGVLALALGSGCALASEQPRFDPNPDEISITSTVPAPGATDISADVRIDLCWSGLLDPRSVSDADATISSGNAVVDTDLQVQLIAWRGPGGTDLPPGPAGSWCSGSVLSITPDASLAGGVTHRLRLQPSAVGWGGEEIDREGAGWLNDVDGEAFVLEFGVVRPPHREPEDDVPAPPATTLSSLFDAGRIFDPARAACGCHAGGDERASALLDLSNPASAFEDLVVPGQLRDTGFPMVTARRPSESFLLHKLLRGEDGDPLRGVLGDAMPGDGTALPYADVVDVARWIEGGALP